MALQWATVKPAHVERACEEVAALHVDKPFGIVVMYRGRALPAKEVLRIAYRLANGLDASSEVKFSSGDASLAILKRLGFEAERRMRPASS